MGNFWSLRRRGIETDGSAAVQPVEHLEPVEIYTVGALLTGVVAPHGQRLSDMLNQGSVLRVRDTNLTAYQAGVQIPAAEGGAWHSVDTSDILFVMPPEHLSSRQLRIHRSRHRVKLEVGDFEVTGTAHMPPGTALDVYVLRTKTRFVALTHASAYSRTDPAWERSASVILVNVAHAADLKEVLTIA